MQRHRNPANGYRNCNRGGFLPPRRIDVFMEAGKLATEYLVSKGLHPPNPLNRKWQNSNLKNPINGGRKRFPDDYSSPTGSRDEIRARTSIGSLKNPRLELNREINRFSGSTEEQNQSPDENSGIKTSISDVSHQDCVESDEKSDGKNVNTNNSSSDLLTLIRFNKVPTRTRSSMTLKGSKSDSVLISGDGNKNKNLNSVQNDENQESKHEPKIEQTSSEEDHKYKFVSISEQINDRAELAKKPRDWASANPQTNDYLHNSFKICDLNLMEVSDEYENHVRQSNQDRVTVDFDLTMDSSCDLPNRHVTRGADGKGVEIIDLDCDSVQDENNNSERRDEAIFTDLESFPDSMQRVSNMPRDGYGLMISELLETDIPNSSVSTAVNSMHNETSLQNEEGILGDDESIYMSLGEIPISMPKL